MLRHPRGNQRELFPNAVLRLAPSQYNSSYSSRLSHYRRLRFGHHKARILLAFELPGIGCHPALVAPGHAPGLLWTLSEHPLRPLTPGVLPRRLRHLQRDPLTQHRIAIETRIAQIIRSPSLRPLFLCQARLSFPVPLCAPSGGFLRVARYPPGAAQPRVGTGIRWPFAGEKGISRQ